MLLKMLPEQVSKYWTDLKMSIAASLPENGQYQESNLTNIFKMMLSDEMQCWTIVCGEEKDIHAVMTTVFIYDPAGIKNLLIYTLYAFKPVSNEEWQVAFDNIKTWAAGKGCKHITAQTENARVIDITKRLGGKVLSTVMFDL